MRHVILAFGILKCNYELIQRSASPTLYLYVYIEKINTFSMKVRVHINKIDIKSKNGQFLD